MILGTAQLGMEYGIHNTAGKPDREAAFQLLDYAWKHGVAVLDTAGAYGDSEELIGSYQEITRHRFRICTKTVSSMAGELGRELENSLRRLKSNSIWIYYLHRFEACKDQEVRKELGRMKGRGKVSKIGISLYEPEELEYVLEALPEFADVVQIPFNLLDHARWLEGGLLERAREKNIKVFARSVFLQGLFFQEPDSEAARGLLAGEALAGLRQVAAECSLSMEQLAVSFAQNQPGIDEILLGCETLEQLCQNISLTETAGRKRLPAEQLWQIRQLSEKVDEMVIDPRKWNSRRRRDADRCNCTGKDGLRKDAQ